MLAAVPGALRFEQPTPPGGARKRGQRPGEDNSQAKLNWDAVRDIRSSDESNIALAIRYGVSPSQVGRVRAGLAWREESAA